MPHDELINLLQQHPLFAQWPRVQLSALSQYFFNRQCHTGDAVVRQGEVVDGIYWILSGQAEVSIQENMSSTPAIVAMLTIGETIGLSASGFFSATGIRTATVTALTDLRLSGITIKALQEFLVAHPEVSSQLQQSSGQLLKIQLIKQAQPFTQLTITQLQQLSAKVQEKTVPAQTVLFQQGDEADFCYLIRSGAVEIYRTDSSDETHKLAELTAPNMFGETAILMDLPRNASARALTETELLLVHRDDLIALIDQEETSATALAKLALERSYPKKYPHIIASTRTTDDGQLIATLKNPEENRYYQLTREGWFIWQQADGFHTVRDIAFALHQQNPNITVDAVSALLVDLSEAGFLELPGIDAEQTEEELTWWENVIKKAKKIMEASYSFKSTDAWLTRTYEKWVKILFSRWCAIFFALLGITGLIAFAFFAPSAQQIIDRQTHWLWLIVFIDIVSLSTIALHELGHAYATKHFGREVPHFGIGWYWIGPIAFTDTSDMWLSGRRQRVIVDMAGIYVDFILAGISALLAFIVPDPVVAIFFWLFALFAYLDIFHNLNPIIELDGYYLLMDGLERHNLREDAVFWLVKILPARWWQLRMYKQYYCEVLYWSACIFYIIGGGLLTYFLQIFILQHIFPMLTESVWKWILPVVAITLSFLSVWLDVRQRLPALEKKNQP